MDNDDSNGRFIEILLVEDNPDDARRIELMLQSANELYRLHTASSTKSALQQLTTLKVQLMLLDLSLPDSKGVDAVRTLHIARPWVPIIILADQDDEPVVAEAAIAGGHDFLLKEDLTATNLSRVLRYALERRFNEKQLRASQALYQRQSRELNLLNRIISFASASSQELEILRDTCWELAQFYDTIRTLVLLHNFEDSIATVRAEYFQPGMQPVLQQQINLEVESSLTAASLNSHTLILPTIPSSLAQLLTVPNSCKALIQPLVLEGKKIGYFVLCFPSTHAFAASDGQLVATVAEEVGLAMEKMRLHGRLQAYANELEERVQKRTQDLAEANEQLQSLDKLKSKFVSDVSHELRNPITNLTLYLELLEFAPPQKQAKYFATLRTQVRRLSSLVEEILTLSRLENSGFHHLYQPVDLNYLVQQAVNAHTPRAQSKQLKLNFAPTIPLPRVWGEPNQITQIVTNLLDNALNYTGQGVINITTDLQASDENPTVVLGVADSGRGIPEEDLPHIFERFYRGAQVDRDAIVGTGLGLGIVSEIVALHNGRIEVSSTPNQGSHFTVTLPVATDT